MANHDPKRNPQTPSEVCEAIRGRRHHNPMHLMLDALSEALQADMESGAHWMNEAASAEFRKKYPRFVTLFEVARRIDWSTSPALQRTNTQGEEPSR